MADRFQFELDHRGLAEILTSDRVRRDLEAAAARAARAAGPGMAYDSENGHTRARATVWTDTVEAMIAEATTRALTRAIDAARR